MSEVNVNLSYDPLSKEDLAFVATFDLDHEKVLVTQHLENMYAEHRSIFMEYVRDEPNYIHSDEAEIKLDIHAKAIAGKLTGEAKEVLAQIIESPKFDGDVVSKKGKSELYGHGLVIRIANNNDFGDNAANRLGWKVHKILIGK